MLIYLIAFTTLILVGIGLYLRIRKEQTRIEVAYVVPGEKDEYIQITNLGHYPIHILGVGFGISKRHKALGYCVLLKASEKKLEPGAFIKITCISLWDWQQWHDYPPKYFQISFDRRKTIYKRIPHHIIDLYYEISRARQWDPVPRR